MTGDMVEVCSAGVWMSLFHIFGKLYVFDSYFAFNHTHIMSEALNWISNFVLMLLVIIPIFNDSRRHG